MIMAFCLTLYYCSASASAVVLSDCVGCGLPEYDLWLITKLGLFETDGAQ